MSTQLRSQPMTVAEHTALRAYLTKLGFTTAQLNAGVHQHPANRSRAQIAADLANYLRQAPKA